MFIVELDWYFINTGWSLDGYNAEFTALHILWAAWLVYIILSSTVGLLHTFKNIFLFTTCHVHYSSRPEQTLDRPRSFIGNASVEFTQALPKYADITMLCNTVCRLNCQKVWVLVDFKMQLWDIPGLKGHCDQGLGCHWLKSGHPRIFSCALLLHFL